MLILAVLIVQFGGLDFYLEYKKIRPKVWGGFFIFKKDPSSDLIDLIGAEVRTECFKAFRLFH